MSAVTDQINAILDKPMKKNKQTWNFFDKPDKEPKYRGRVFTKKKGKIDIGWDTKFSSINNLFDQLILIASFDPDHIKPETKKTFKSLGDSIMSIKETPSTIGLVQQLKAVYNVIGGKVGGYRRHFYLPNEELWFNYAVKYINENVLIHRLKRHFPVNSKVIVTRPYKSSDARIVSISKVGIRVRFNQGEQTGQIKLIPMNMIDQSKRPAGLSDPIVKASFSVKELQQRLNAIKEAGAAKVNRREFEKLTSDIAIEYISSPSSSLKKLVDDHTNFVKKLSISTLTVKQKVDKMEEEEFDEDIVYSEDKIEGETEKFAVSGDDFDAHQGMSEFNQRTLTKIKNTKPKTPEGVIIQDFMNQLFGKDEMEEELDLRIPKKVYEDISKMKELFQTRGIDSDNSNLLKAIVISRLFFVFNSVLPKHEFINPYILASCGEGNIFSDYKFVACAAGITGDLKNVNTFSEGQLVKLMSGVTLFKNLVDLYISEFGLKIFNVKKNYDVTKPLNYQAAKDIKRIQKKDKNGMTRMDYKRAAKRQERPNFMRLDTLLGDDTGRVQKYKNSSRSDIINLVPSDLRDYLKNIDTKTLQSIVTRKGVQYLAVVANKEAEKERKFKEIYDKVPSELHKYLVSFTKKELMEQSTDKILQEAMKKKLAKLKSETKETKEKKKKKKEKKVVKPRISEADAKKLLQGLDSRKLV